MQDPSVVLAFRVPASIAQRIRQAAARDDRLPGPFLRRLVQEALAKKDGRADG